LKVKRTKRHKTGTENGPEKKSHRKENARKRNRMEERKHEEKRHGRNGTGDKAQRKGSGDMA